MTHGTNGPDVRSWEYPDCPMCDSDVFVDCLNREHNRFFCQLCSHTFTKPGWIDE